MFAPEDPEKGVLDNVVAIFPVSEDSEHKVCQGVLEASDQFCEPGLISLLEGGHKLFVRLPTALVSPGNSRLNHHEVKEFTEPLKIDAAMNWRTCLSEMEVDLSCSSAMEILMSAFSISTSEYRETAISASLSWDGRSLSSFSATPRL